MLSVFTMGTSTQDGKLVDDPVKIPGTGEVNYFASVGLTVLGDCLAWSSACPLRTAIAKCPGTKQCNVYVGAGIHDTDNGVDATDTAVSTRYVRLIGFGQPHEHGQMSVLANKAASVSHILVVTGDHFVAQNLVFDNKEQTDKNVIMLSLDGDYSITEDCVFRQNPGDGGGTGILVGGGSQSHTISRNRFLDVVDRGLDYGNASKVYASNNVFWRCGTGFYTSSVLADNGIFIENQYLQCTTAVNLNTAYTNTFLSSLATYIGNVTNFASVSAYAGNIFIERTTAYGSPSTLYPVGAGTAISKDADAWTWGAYNDIIPAGTFSKPVRLVAIHMQSWSAAQIFNVELFYGSASPGTTSLGVHQVVLGSTTPTGKVDSPLNLNMYIPAHSTVGAKVMSSTGGSDSITVAIEYESL